MEENTLDAGDFLAAAQRLLFTAALTLASRYFLLRDRLFRNIDRCMKAPGVTVSRHFISSGDERLDAVIVAPSDRPAKAALLICHGIGETVEHWFGVQRLLAASGVASLVFDYAGYGRSTGTIRAEQCERGAVAAFEFLQTSRPGLPISVLGFSLGTGIAVAVLGRIAAEKLIVCSSYTSFREAALRVGLPRRLAFLAPPIWDTEAALRAGEAANILIVHGGRDSLFPVAMAERLHAAAGPRARLAVFPRIRHDDPYCSPQAGYWGSVAGHLLS